MKTADELAEALANQLHYARLAASRIADARDQASQEPEVDAPIRKIGGLNAAFGFEASEPGGMGGRASETNAACSALRTSSGRCEGS